MADVVTSMHDGPLVCVVEDDPAIQGLLDRILRAEGYRVVPIFVEEVERVEAGVASSVASSVPLPPAALLDCDHVVSGGREPTFVGR